MPLDLFTSSWRLRLCLFPPLTFLLLGAGGFAQGTLPYSKTPEYQRMLEELRSPAPSPIYLATGMRPLADQHLGVKVDNTADTFQVETDEARLSVALSGASVSVQNRRSGASWSFDVSREGCTESAAAGARTGTARPSGTHHWVVQLPTPCGATTLDFELLTARLARLTLRVEGNAGAAAATRGTIHLHVRGGGPYFGLGERFWQAGLSGTKLDVRPQDRYGEPGHQWTYVAVPLVYGPGGLGFYADTAFDTRFRFEQADTSFDMEMAGSPVPIYLFTEATPKGVLSAYTGLTGHPPDPPLWTFGPWITALGGRGAVLDSAHRIRAEDMPASALWVYDQNDVKNNLGWPFWFSSYYGEPRSFVETLHGQGFRVLTYVHPYLREQMEPYFFPNPEYQKGVAEGLLVTGADGKPAGPRFEVVPVGNVDFTNPAAVDMWQSMIGNAVGTQGFDGWMEDFGEWVRYTDRFHVATGRTMSELYPLLYHKITFQVAQALKPSVVTFSRSGSSGSQGFSPAMWGADQSANWSRDYGLPSVVTAGITAGMSGYSTWGPDILSTGSDRDLWMRWVQFGALSPVMRDHVWDKPAGSINAFSDAAATQHFRHWAAFHSSLLPYLKTYAEEAHRTGVPIMRHTVLEFPEDPRSATAEYQYLLGHEMLVAPVVQGGQTMRTLYLPRGEWVNFWTGDFLTGGQDVTVGATDIPLLVRAGSVLPFKPEEEAGHWDWDDPQLLETSLVWRAYPSNTGKADTTFALSNGTSAHLVQHGNSVVLEGVSRTVRDYQVIVRTRDAPSAVRLNGVPFRPVTPGPGGRAASQWWWDPSTSEVHLRFRASTFRAEIEGIVTEAYNE